LEERAQPGARANGPKRPWLILNVRQRKDAASLPPLFARFRAEGSCCFFAVQLAEPSSVLVCLSVLSERESR
jgi:hypothetical protein